MLMHLYACICGCIRAVSICMHASAAAFVPLQIQQSMLCICESLMYMQVCSVCASMFCICKHLAYLPACCVCTRTVTNDASMCVRTQLLVELATATPNATIRVTSDGSDPSPQVSRTPVRCVHISSRSTLSLRHMYTDVC